MDIGDEVDIENLPKDSFYEKLIYIIKKLNLNRKTFARNCGFSESLLARWKNGSVPRIATIKKISDYTNYPIDFFINPATLPENTLGAIIQKYRLLSGLTKNQLAEIVGISVATITDYESDNIKGSNEGTVNRIFEAIGYMKK